MNETLTVVLRWASDNVPLSLIILGVFCFALVVIGIVIETICKTLVYIVLAFMGKYPPPETPDKDTPA